MRSHSQQSSKLGASAGHQRHVTNTSSVLGGINEDGLLPEEMVVVEEGEDFVGSAAAEAGRLSEDRESV
jgi:hypothetical protein